MTDQTFPRMQILLVFLTCLFVLGATYSGLLKPLDNLLSDRLLVLNAGNNVSDERIVIVDIDDYSIQSLEQYAGRWPWPRSLHAELIELLHAAGTRALVFDVLFSERDLYRPEADAYFSEAVEATSAWLPSLILDTRDRSEGMRFAEIAQALGARAGSGANPDASLVMLLPRAVDREFWKSGLINFEADGDGIGRRYPLWIEREGWRLPMMVARIARSLGAELPDRQSVVMNWQSADPRTYKALSYADVYRGLLEEDENVLESVRDRIVFIGASAAGLHDIDVTPISGLHHGTQILATALDNLLNDEYLTAPPWYAQAILGVGMVLLIAGAWWFTRLVWVTVVVALLLSMIVTMVCYGLIIDGLVMPFATALLASWVYVLLSEFMEYRRESQMRQHALRVFGRFLDPVVVEALAESGSTESALEARSCEITVLFADIRDFTRLSEEHEADAIMRLLNEYFSCQLEVIFKNLGTLDKFIGDALMAFWGAPVDNPDHAASAVRAALEMSAALDDFRKVSGFPDLNIGIGVHTGTAMVGMVGSDQRYDYTVIGDTVNLASRIEGHTKDCARILVSAATRKACGDRFRFEDRGLFKIKGREEDVRLYEPINRVR